jgi:hypothetical protein
VNGTKRLCPYQNHEQHGLSEAIIEEPKRLTADYLVLIQCFQIFSREWREVENVHSGAAGYKVVNE